MSTVYGVTQEFVQNQSIGLFGKRYVGYFNDDFDFFTADKEYDTGRVFMSIDSFSSSANTYSWMWLGYFVPPTSGDYTFYTNSDGSSWMWVGEGAHRNTTVDNAVVNNSGVHGLQEVSGTKYLRANKLYPVKILFGDNTSASEAITVSFSGPSIAKTTDGRGYFLSGPYLFDSLYNTTTRTYPANGYEPDLVLDFENNYFRVNGEDTDFESALTHSRTSNATMVDNDGLIKWAPHNLLPDSENWSYVVARGSTNPVTEVPGPFPGTIALNNSGTGEKWFTSFFLAEHPGNVIFGIWVKVNSYTGAAIRLANSSSSFVIDMDNPNWAYYEAEFDNEPSTLSLRPLGTTEYDIDFYAPRIYRTTLGGMVNNPDPVDPSDPTYVPTTSGARYLARRGHHVYNGTEWVNEGVLIESAARTNLQINSDIGTITPGYGMSIVPNAAIGPDGELSAALYGDNGDGGTGYPALAITLSPTPNTPLTFSGFFKAGGTPYLRIEARNFDSLPQGQSVNIDLSTGIFAGQYFTSEKIDYENGWYRISLTIEADLIPTVNGTEFFRIIASEDDSYSQLVTRDGTNNILIYGIQEELSATPSSYIPTNGATATRAGDSLSIPFANTIPVSTNLSYSYIGKSTFVDNNAFKTLTFYEQNYTENLFILSLNVGGNNLGRFYNYFDGIIYTRDNVKTAGINVSFNLASRANTTEIQFAQDGTPRTVISSSGSPPTLTEDMIIASHNNDASNMTLKLFKGWGADIGTAGIEEASS